MYSDKDRVEIDAAIRSAVLALAIALAALLAGYVAGLALRIKGLTYLAGVALFVAAAFIGLHVLRPRLRYRRFLDELKTGLTREAEGEVLEIAREAEEHDGCRVLPVRLRDAHAEGGERIVYLNAAKAAGFPEPGSRVRLSLYGRHIRAIERA